MRYMAAVLAAAAILASAGCNESKEQAMPISGGPEPLRSADTLQPVAPLSQADDASPAQARPMALNDITDITDAQSPLPPGDFPAPLGRTYTIRPNDTLWSISKNHLGDGKRWKEIVELNPGLDPAKLQPGSTIKLPSE